MKENIKLKIENLRLRKKHSQNEKRNTEEGQFEFSWHNINRKGENYMPQTTYRIEEEMYGPARITETRSKASGYIAQGFTLPEFPSITLASQLVPDFKDYRVEEEMYEPARMMETRPKGTGYIAQGFTLPEFPSITLATQLVPDFKDYRIEEEMYEPARMMETRPKGTGYIAQGFTPPEFHPITTATQLEFEDHLDHPYYLPE